MLIENAAELDYIVLCTLQPVVKELGNRVRIPVFREPDNRVRELIIIIKRGPVLK